jgi:hypothetical protein
VAAARKASREPIFPVSNLPAQHKAAQPNRQCQWAHNQNLALEHNELLINF